MRVSNTCHTSSTLSYSSFVKDKTCKHKVEINDDDLIVKIENQLKKDFLENKDKRNTAIKVNTVITLYHGNEKRVFYMDCFGNCVELENGKETAFYTDLIYWFNTFSNQESSSCL